MIITRESQYLEKTQYDQQLATMGDTRTTCDEVSSDHAGGDVYSSNIFVWIAIYKIWICIKFIMVRLDLLWLGQSKTTIRRRRMKAVVWSKPACPSCAKAKNLLKNKGIEYEEKNIAQGYNIQDLLELVPNAKTMPQIWLDEEHIGGFSDLKEKLQG